MVLKALIFSFMFLSAKSASTRMPAAFRASTTLWPYSLCSVRIGTTATWSGHIQKGKLPLKCSMMIPMKRSREP